MENFREKHAYATFFKNNLRKGDVDICVVTVSLIKSSVRAQQFPPVR